MTAHPQENPDAYEGADMDAEMDARKRGAWQMLERRQGGKKRGMNRAGKEAGKEARSINHLSGYPLVDPLTICPGSRGFPVGGDLVH